MQKNLDQQGRWRNKVVAFRMSEEEGLALDKKVSLSGLSKQDYIIKRLLCKDIIVNGNPRVFKALRNRTEEICQELQRLDKLSPEHEDLISSVEFITRILDGMKNEPVEHREDIE